MSNIASTLSLNLPAITALCTGPRGSLIFAASGLPNSTNLGLSGDYYIDTSTGFYYGPKTTSYPSTPLFSLNTPLSSFVYTFVNNVTSLSLPQFGNNSINFTNNNSAILGGQNNSLTGDNSFIIGSNIVASVTGFTLVNNLSSTGGIFASAGNSDQWYNASTNVTTNSANWQNTKTTVQTNSASWANSSTNVVANSANWQSTYTNVSANSANWQSSYTNYYNQAYLTYAQYTLNTNLSSIVPARGTFTVTGTASNINGGNFNNVLSAYSSVLGGKCNTASGYYSNITGGFSGRASGKYSNIAGGVCNTASGYGASIAGGTGNVAYGSNATIGAGAYNTASNSSTFIGGGRGNTASGVRSIVVGGFNNTASGDYSFVAGSSANDTRGLSHTFILGTGLSANLANYTYVNNISSQGIVSDATGSSSQWNSVYTAVSTTSAAWQNTKTTVQTNSASWANAYTYLSTNTANTFTVNNFTANGTGNVTSTLTVNDNTTIGYVNNASTGLRLTKGSTYGIPAIQGVTNTLGTNQDITINSQGGNVGIGTTTPNSIKLSVQRSSGNSSTADIRTSDGTQWIQFNSNESAGVNNTLIQNNDASIVYSAGTIDSVNSAIVIGPYSASAKGIRINSSGNLTVAGSISASNALSVASIYTPGNVGIGTSPSVAKLEVFGGTLGSTVGNTIELARFSDLNTNAGTLRIYQNRFSAGNNWTSAETRIQQRTDVTDQGYISFNPDGNGSVAIGAGGSERVRINATDGSVTSTGNETVLSDGYGSNDTGNGANTISLNYANGVYVGSGGAGTLNAKGVAKYNYLAGNGSAIGTAITNFGLPTLSLVANATYELEYNVAYLRGATTNGTVVYTLVGSTTYASVNGTMVHGPLAGVGTQGAVTSSSIFTTTAANVVLPATGAQTFSTNQQTTIKFLIRTTSTANNVYLAVTNSASTIAPVANSYSKLTRIA